VFTVSSDHDDLTYKVLCRIIEFLDLYTEVKYAQTNTKKVANVNS